MRNERPVLDGLSTDLARKLLRHLIVGVEVIALLRVAAQTPPSPLKEKTSDWVIATLLLAEELAEALTDAVDGP